MSVKTERKEDSSMENEGAKATGSSVSVNVPPEVAEAGVQPIHQDAELISSVQGTPAEVKGEIAEHHTEPLNIIEFPTAKKAMDIQKGENKRSASRWERLWIFRRKHNEEVKNAA